MRYDEAIVERTKTTISPVLIGCEDCEKSHSFGPAVRNYWLIHYIISGFGLFKSEGKTYNLGAGEMFVISPYEETYYEADSSNPWSYIWVGFTIDGDMPSPLPKTFFCPQAQKIFEGIKYEAISNKEQKSASIKARLWDLFSLLSEGKTNEPDYVDKALAIIHSEFMNDISVETIASRLGLNRSYFSVIFKEKMNISPKEYLMVYRMNFAASLIINEKKSISTAAYSVGYPDIYNFSKMFKKHFGVSPREYIQKKGNVNND